jgi:hypothetical protein
MATGLPGKHGLDWDTWKREKGLPGRCFGIQEVRSGEVLLWVIPGINKYSSG